jgi:hypothetical protein
VAPAAPAPATAAGLGPAAAAPAAAAAPRPAAAAALAGGVATARAASAAAAAQAPAPGLPPPLAFRPERDEDPDEATVVSQVASEILGKLSADRGTDPPPPILDETAEWRRVYDEFVRLKKECGEATEGLNFEKFKSTLRKNRDQLLQRHGCKSVKFSVYLKDGKAALKANPVRE